MALFISLVPPGEQLIPSEVLQALPHLHRESERSFPPENPTIFAVLDADDVSFYVAEGGLQDGEFTLWGFLVQPRRFTFPLRFTIPISRLECGDWVGNEVPRLRPSFRRRAWKEIYAELFLKKNGSLTTP